MLDGHEPHACVRDFAAHVGADSAARVNADVVFGLGPLVLSPTPPFSVFALRAVGDVL